MNPKLHIMKLKNAKDYSSGRAIRFAVVDFDRGKSYPSNFICVLPQNISFADDHSSIFARIFKETRIDLAKKLLNSALESEQDSEIRTEIEDRLRNLTLKSIQQPKNRF
jgi:hypothetical protein